MRYYIADESQPKGFIEVSEAEYNSLFGDEIIRPYAQAVYSGAIAVEDVPTEHQEAVRTVVANKISRWGIYDEAIDIENAPFTYEETDILIEGDMEVR